MSKPIYQLGDVVRTPGHGEGVIVTINRGAIRGRTWREVSYTIKLASSAHAVVYYESELTRSTSPAQTARWAHVATFGATANTSVFPSTK